MRVFLFFNVLGIGIGQPQKNDDFTWLQVAMMEFMGSLFLQLVYLYFTQSKAAPQDASGFAVGSTFGVCIMSTQFFTGGAINPSRAIGPLLFSFQYKAIFFYTLSTWGGSITGYFVYKYLLMELNDELRNSEEDEDDSEDEEGEKKSFNPKPKEFKEDKNKMVEMTPQKIIKEEQEEEDEKPKAREVSSDDGL